MGRGEMWLFSEVQMLTPSGPGIGELSGFGETAEEAKVGIIKVALSEDCFITSFEDEDE